MEDRERYAELKEDNIGAARRRALWLGAKHAAATAWPWTTTDGNVGEAINRDDEIRVWKQRHTELEWEHLQAEAADGFPAVSDYATLIDDVADSIPAEARETLYYPAAGLDLYWARLAPASVFQDLGYSEDEHLTNWYTADAYAPEHRAAITSVLEDGGLLPEDHAIDFVDDDLADRGVDAFEDEHTTLLLKSYPGIDDIGTPDDLSYGAVVHFPKGASLLNYVTPLDRKTSIDDRIGDGYTTVMDEADVAPDAGIPYSCGFSDVEVFVRDTHL